MHGLLATGGLAALQVIVRRNLPHEANDGAVVNLDRATGVTCIVETMNLACAHWGLVLHTGLGQGTLTERVLSMSWLVGYERSS